MGLRGSWCAAHGVRSRWVAAVVASWGGLAGFATVTVPLKYPLAARADVVDSGVVVGLLVPLVISGLVLDEGPPDLVRGASRTLGAYRLALGAIYLATAAAGAAATALLVGLPVALIVLDGLAAGGLVVLGTVLLGPRAGWLPAASVSVVVSTPGLVPWEWNAAYQREVGPWFAGTVALLLAAALGAYVRRGSV
jgi:hypothetical protein